MLRKITDCGYLGISQENFYHGVFFSKVTSLQCSNCKFITKRTHHRFFLEYVPKTNCPKQNKKKKIFFFLRKKYMVDQRLDKVVAL